MFVMAGMLVRQPFCATCRFARYVARGDAMK